MSFRLRRRGVVRRFPLREDEAFGLEGALQSAGLTGPDRESEDAPAAVRRVTQLEVAYVDLALLERSTYPGQFAWSIGQSHLHSYHRRSQSPAGLSSLSECPGQTGLVALGDGSRPGVEPPPIGSNHLDDGRGIAHQQIGPQVGIGRRHPGQVSE